VNRRLLAALLAVFVGAIAVVVAALLVQSALADGDPASDYLISQQVFVPFQGVSTKTAGEITALLNDSKQKGFPLKVAVISSPYDLGAVPSLFRKPQQYASFLGQEDYYFFKDELLVVMPNGYGLYKHAGVPAADKAAIKALPPPGTANGDSLVAAAEHAVRVLAARHGVTLSAADKSGGSSKTSDRVEILAGVLALAALAIGARLLLRQRERR
jgi:hypothetical protein